MLSVFDLDHTLLNTNCSLQFGKFLKSRKVISSLNICYLFYLYFRHKFLGMSLEKLHVKSLEILKGKSLKTMLDLVDLFVERHFDQMLNQAVYKRLLEAKANKHIVMIASNSPEFLVKAFAVKMGVENVIGVQILLSEDCFLKAPLEKQDGVWKRDRVMNKAKELLIPIKDIIAYSDSYYDLPLLQAVGKAIGVNPDKALYTHCVQERWEIIK